MIINIFSKKKKSKILQEKYLSTFYLLRWYVKFFKGDYHRIFGGVLLTLLQSFALIPIPFILKRIIDSDLPNKDITGLFISGSAAMGFYFLNALFSFSGRSLTLLSTKRVTETLRARLCMQLQQMSLSFYDKERASELHARVVIDTERIDVMGNAIIVHGISSVIMFFLAAVILAYLNLKLCVIAFAMIPIFYFVQRMLRPMIRASNQSFRQMMESMSSEINDLLQSIRLVKQFAREEHEQERAENRFKAVTKSALNMTILDSFYGNLMAWLTNTTTILIYIVGGILFIKSKMTLGEIIAFVGMLGFLISPVNVLMNMITMVYAGLASLGPVYTLLNLHDPLEKDDGKIILPKLHGAVEFDNVTFIYPSTDKIALKNINVKINPGETVALVGESGAGKTTFVNLILGFYFASKGKIKIDNIDITNLNLKNLREQIGVVSQDNVLLNTSIRQNLLYGRQNASEIELIEAARKANALEFIEKTDEGFEAIVGDRGVRLSGGQRQRLAIARALLKNPQILILDEATSSLDSESEEKIQQALEKLKINRTCFIIAHRLSTVINADRILVFKDGSLVEEGTHIELLSKDGEYARLCKIQFKSFMQPK